MSRIEQIENESKPCGAFVVSGGHGRALKALARALQSDDSGIGVDLCIGATGHLTEEEAALLALGLLKGLPWEIARQVSDAALYDHVGPLDPVIAEGMMMSARTWAQSASELEIRAHVHEGVKRMAPRSIAKLRERLK
jgi:hypothetical protein